MYIRYLTVMTGPLNPYLTDIPDIAYKFDIICLKFFLSYKSLYYVYNIYIGVCQL